MDGDVTLPEHLARHIHRDQVDKAGRPYVDHLKRVVANLLRRWPDATGDEIAAAWLHDAIEDTDWDADLLRRAGISPSAVAIVEEVTRTPPSFPYLAWIQTLSALGSRSAIRIKLADNEDNRDPARVAALAGGEKMLRKRYLPAQQMLEEGLVWADQLATMDQP